jgi:hypothetical protein
MSLLTRLLCARCNEDTLHQGLKCIHCGKLIQPWRPPEIKLTREVVNRSTVQRRRGGRKAHGRRRKAEAQSHFGAQLQPS